jgi:hypothetical protein
LSASNKKYKFPIGFLDTPLPFATKVLNSLPKKDYEGVPLSEEDLPMFWDPTGCKSFCSKYQDAPLPEYYGFVAVVTRLNVPVDVATVVSQRRVSCL